MGRKRGKEKIIVRHKHAHTDIVLSTIVILFVILKASANKIYIFELVFMEISNKNNECIHRRENERAKKELTFLAIWMSAPIWHRSQISGLFSSRTSFIFCSIIAWLSSMPFNWFRDKSNNCRMKKNIGTNTTLAGRMIVQFHRIKKS